MEAFSHRLFASSSRSSLARRCWWQRRWREMVVVVVAVDTSFIFHPTTHHLPVPACPRSLPLFASYLLRQPHRVAPSWALPLSPSLRPSFLLSRSGSVVVSIARGNRDSLPPFLRRCFSLFLLFFVSFLSASILLARSIRPHLSFVLFALYILFLLSLLLHLNRLEYFGNYSRPVLFFHAETCLCYSPFSFRLYFHYQRMWIQLWKAR